MIKIHFCVGMSLAAWYGYLETGCMELAMCATIAFYGAVCFAFRRK